EDNVPIPEISAGALCQNHVTKNPETNEKILPIPEENSSLSADLGDYINMLTGTLDDETANWGTPYENEARVEKVEVNEVKSDDEVTPGPKNVPSGSEEEVDHDSTPNPVEETNDDNDWPEALKHSHNNNICL
ncbi:12413_t:CDS:1, partial [Funneliformis caledonium]